MKVIIIFYTKEPKPIELYYLESTQALEEYNKRIVELTKHKALFAVYKIGDCVGDFS